MRKASIKFPLFLILFFLFASPSFAYDPSSYYCIVVASPFSSRSALPVTTSGTGTTCSVTRNTSIYLRSSDLYLLPSSPQTRDCTETSVTYYTSTSSTLAKVYGFSKATNRWIPVGSYAAITLQNASVFTDADLSVITEWGVSSETTLASRYPTCSDLPEDCNDEWDALVSQCGGEDKVASWVSAPENNPPICQGTCMCPDQTSTTALTACAEQGGWTLDYNSYADGYCKPVCDNCRDEYASGVNSADCEYGAWTWDNEICKWVCKSCNTAYLDCMGECGGDVYFFDCSGDGPSLGDHCVCEAPEEVPPEPGDPEAEPDPGDDPTDPDDDPGDDPTPDPQEPTDPDPEPEPKDPDPDPADDPDDGANGWLKAIKHNTDDIVDQNDAIKGYAHDTASNTADIVRGLNDANATLGNIAENAYATAGNTGKILDALKDLEIEQEDMNMSGGSGTPDPNTYDSELESVEESSFVDAVTGYLANGLPIISYLNGSYVNIVGASPVMSVDLWGYVIDFDISPVEDFLDTMGIILFGVCSIAAFFIVIGRW